MQKNFYLWRILVHSRFADSISVVSLAQLPFARIQLNSWDLRACKTLEKQFSSLLLSEKDGAFECIYVNDEVNKQPFEMVDMYREEQTKTVTAKTTTI